MVAHALETAPDECCGLLLGRDDHLVEAVPVRNTADDRLRRYRIDPAEHFAVIRSARARHLDVLGAYHSHPRSAPTPSPTDRAEAFGAFLFVIIAVAPVTDVRAFRFENGNFVPVPFVRDR
jgi:proteasome lid subunit RPN8/RPN11